MSKQKYWSTYFTSVLLISVVLGYLMNSQKPFEKMVLTALYFFIYFTALLLAGVYHYKKIGNLKTGLGIIFTILSFCISGLLLHIIDDYTYLYYKIIYNDFMHWFVPGLFVGCINGLGILLLNIIKRKS